MTRKDYEMLSNAFKAARRDVLTKEPEEQQQDMLDGICLAAEHVADDLARQSSGFDGRRFLYDCGCSA